MVLPNLTDRVYQIDQDLAHKSLIDTVICLMILYFEGEPAEHIFVYPNLIVSYLFGIIRSACS